MSFLTIIQNAALVTIGTDVSTTYSRTPEVKELVYYAKQEGRELVKRGDWRVLRRELTYTTLGQEEQTSFIPSDCDHLVSDTIWNRTRRLPIWGPVTPQEWQNIKAWTTSPIKDTVYIRGSSALVAPVPPAGQTIAAEYVTKNYCIGNGVPQSDWSDDNDTTLLPEYLFELGVILRYKMAKGLDTSAALSQYETQVRQYLEQDNPKRTIDLANTDRYGGGRQPGVVVPPGNWGH